MRCLGCKYDLAGIKSGVCPECGRPFDLDDSRTYGPRFSGRSAHILFRVGIVVFAGPVAASALSSALCWLIVRASGHWPPIAGEHIRDIPHLRPLLAVWRFAGGVSCITWLMTPFLAGAMFALRGSDTDRRVTRMFALSGLAAWSALTIILFTGLPRWMND